MVKRKSISSHQQAIKLIVRAAEVFRKEGIVPFFRAAARKVLLLFGIRVKFLQPKTSIKKRDFSKIDLRTNPFGDPGGYDILCLPIIDWDYRFQRPQQLLVQQAMQGHRVFYGSVECSPDAYNPREILKRIRILSKRIWDFQFPSPLNEFDLYQSPPDPSQVDFFVSSLAALKKAAGIENAVILVDFPNWAPVAVNASQKFGWPVIYDCMEDHGGYSELPSSVENQEAELARSAGLVLAVSEKIQARVKEYNQNVITLPNAADFSHFRYPIHAFDPFPDLPRPVIGYFGVISEWFDMDLLVAAARRRPDWSFVLIGEVFKIDIKEAEKQKNIHFLGEQPYEELPRYANHFDAAMICHKRVRRTEWAGSVKLYEYLSAGRPVVAPPLQWLQHLDEYVYFAEDPDTFIAAVEKALAEDSVEKRNKRLAFARKNSWKSRSDMLSGAIESLFPKASIIILTHNNLDVTQLCLDSIAAYTDYPNYEVIVVDNASTDGTCEYLLAQQTTNPRLKTIFNDENVGFARGNNQGLEAASGDYIVLLNNDTIVTRRWLSKLIRYLKDRSIGAVGPVTNMSGNESRINVSYRRLEDIHPFAREYTQKNAGKTFEINMLTMFCAAMRREIINEVGGLDERYGMGMFEDDDFALRIKKAGYRMLCASDVFVHHFGNATFQLYGKDLYANLLEENRKKFEEKWGITWEPHKARQ